MRVRDVGESKGLIVMIEIRVETLFGVKTSPLPTGLLWQESLKNRFYEEKQMIDCDKTQPGASSPCAKEWDILDWVIIEEQVKRLQMRIAKAVREKRWGKAKSLQWLLTHSRNAKLLAVKRITSNAGKKTPGVDGRLLLTSKQKIQTAYALSRRGYQAEPLRRIYIPKKNGKQRPLGIPTIKDRAMQALHLFALEPIAEITADPRSYGFRPKRSTADAIQGCFNALSRRKSAQWILEGDIKACFDQISHQWLLANIPMDKMILKQWLMAGYVEKQQFYPTQAGTPQGGVISPALANMALDGLEAAVKQALPRGYHKVNVIRYADDFVITGATEQILAETIKPAVERFLSERGLQLSQEKTKITSIYKGFDFLGFTVRKYRNEKLLIKPSRASIQSILNTIREILKIDRMLKTEAVIEKLNLKLRGWAYYYRHVVAKKAFAKVDHSVFQAVWRWTKFRHWEKSSKWIKAKYFRTVENRDWNFTAKIKDKTGQLQYLDLFKAQLLPIKRHTTLINAATPYHEEYQQYFADRESVMRRINHGHWNQTARSDWRCMSYA